MPGRVSGVVPELGEVASRQQRTVGRTRRSDCPSLAACSTLLDKIWAAHMVSEDLLYVDLHMVHEVSTQAFDVLRASGRRVRRPDRTVATADHTVPTEGTVRSERIRDRLAWDQIAALERNCADF